MPLKAINREEWWPVFTLTDPDPPEHDPVVDIPQELLDRYEAAGAAWFKVQQDIERLLDALD